MAEFWYAPFASGGAEIPPGAGVPPNVWLDPRSTRTFSSAINSTTYSSAVNFTPYLVTETLTFDRVACGIGGVTTSPAAAHLGIYASDPNTKLPGDLVQYFGETSSTYSGGVPLMTFIDIDLTLQPGMYWRALKLSGGAGRWICTSTGWGGTIHYPWNRGRNINLGDWLERTDERYWTSGFQSSWTSTVDDPLPPNATDEVALREYAYNNYWVPPWGWPSNTGIPQWQALRVVT